ncbi:MULTISPECIES: hypothetical protein [unclassified Rickettsia]|uniref:hypothetical protein n=1 Tax=unclassified Rickettsia TaxID=114295 RepID=UPI003132FD55
MRNQPHVPILPLNPSTASPENKQSLNYPSSEDDEVLEFKKPEDKQLNNDEILDKFRTLIKNEETNKDSIESLFVEYPDILHIAVEQGKEEFVKKILTLKPELIDILTIKDLTVLHSAVLGIADLEMFKILLEAKPTLINAKDQWNKTALDQGRIEGFGKYRKDSNDHQINEQYFLELQEKALELLGINNDVEE